jgi:hypothetical protein
MAGFRGMCLSSQATRESTNRRIVVEAGWSIKQDTISKISQAKRPGGMAQAVEGLPRSQSLSSTPSTTKKILPVHTKTCTQMLIILLFIIAPNKHSPNAHQLVNKL